MRLNKWTGLALGSFLLAGAATASAQVVVQVRPPHAVIERRGHPPERGYIWTPGYQRWDGNRYNWVGGQWQRPPRANAHWVPARWVRHGNHWEFQEGHWR